MDTAKQIERHALAWLVKRHSGDWSEQEQTEFAQWLRERTAHRVTFLRLEAGWERTGRLKAFGVGNAPGSVPAPRAWRASPFFEQRLASSVRSAFEPSPPKVIAAAAAILLAVGSAFYLSSFFGPKIYATPIGAVTSIPLTDGSRVTLNTASKVRVALDEKERRVELQSGEAFFDVAKDPSRPFVVDAGERKIVAVGTRFSVRRDGSQIQVIVTEGKVRIEPWAEGGSPQLLTAGSVVNTTPNSLLVQRKSLEKAEEVLSWRNGYLTFDSTPLADAIAEFNRYTQQRIVIEDPKLAALRISGKFRSTYSEDFVEVLRNGFGIQVRRTDESVHLTAN